MEIAFTSFRFSKDPSGDTRLQCSMSGKRTIPKQNVATLPNQKMSMIRYLFKRRRRTFHLNLLEFPGPSCINRLKIKWEFLQPFPVLRRTFLHAIRSKLTEGGLKTIGNSMTGQKGIIKMHS